MSAAPKQVPSENGQPHSRNTNFGGADVFLGPIADYPLLVRERSKTVTPLTTQLWTSHQSNTSSGMQSLDDILNAIEGYSEIRFADHKSILLFDSQTEFFVSDLVDANGDQLWNAIEIETGKLEPNVAYEPGVGLFYDSVLFYTTAASDCTIIRLPEAGVAIQFAIASETGLASQTEASEDSRYQSDLDFAKLGERNIPWTRFVYEWKALPTKFA